MQTYAEVLSYAIPFFAVLILIEYGISTYKGMNIIRSFDMVSSLSSGLTNSIKDVLGLSIVIVSYEWMVGHLALMSIESELWLYIVTFICLDFAGYWSHRFEHEINVLWNRHIIHHSSEEFNLACALRQNVSAIFGVFFFLLIPIAIIGVPVKIIAVVAPLHLFAQFWYHTRVINKMGFLEWIIVTPSHHRVHHAINDQYMDKNFGQIFIVWDKLFGTFQSELTSETAVYGVKRQTNTWNPFLINFQHLWILLSDAWNTRSWVDKVKVFVMPTGWRPLDMEEVAPIEYTKVASDQVKYDTQGSSIMHLWIWIQLMINIVLMLYLFNNIGDLKGIPILLYGLFLWVSIFSYTSLMDHAQMSTTSELLKLTLGVGLIYTQGGWYGIDQFIPFGTYIMIGYLITSLILNIYFLKESKNNSTLIVVN